MTPTRREVRRIVDLAEMVEADIRRRSLQPGDRYLSTAETAKMLRVDTAVANRALQLLAKRKVISRRQRAGTFIAQVDGTRKMTVLHRVHMLMSDRHPQTEGWLNAETVLAIQNELPGVRLQFHIVPTADEEKQIEQVIRESLQAPQPEGFILIRSSLVTQRLIEASGLLAVIWGHPYASIKNLPFVDRDQRQIGRLMAEYLVERGHRRVLMLMRQRLLPGDHELISGAREVLDKAGLSPSAITQLCLPQDPEEIRHGIESELETSEEVPGIMARPPLMAEVAGEVFVERGLVPMRDGGMVVADYFDKAAAPYAVIRPAYEADHQGARLGRLVSKLARGEKPNPDHRLSPVRLEIPEDV